MCDAAIGTLQRAAIALVMLTMGVCGVAANAGGDDASLEKDSSMTHVSPTAAEIITEARTALASADVPGADILRATPAFPAAWPPDSKSVTVLVFFYRSSPTSRGMKTSDVFSPRAAVSLQLENDVIAETAVERLQEEPIEDRYEDPMESLSRDALYAGTNALLHVLASADTESWNATDARAVYASWVAQNPAISGAIQSQVEPFMDWLDDD